MTFILVALTALEHVPVDALLLQEGVQLGLHVLQYVVEPVHGQVFELSPRLAVGTLSSCQGLLHWDVDLSWVGSVGAVHLGASGSTGSLRRLLCVIRLRWKFQKETSSHVPKNSTNERDVTFPPVKHSLHTRP